MPANGMGKNGAAAGGKEPGIELEPFIGGRVDFDTFRRCDFRAVKVKDCFVVKGSKKKLLQFTLDDGTGTDRTIVSDIHSFCEPEKLIGKTLIAIINLEPRSIMGIESCGMLFTAIHNENGKKRYCVPVMDGGIPAGAKLC